MLAKRITMKHKRITFFDENKRTFSHDLCAGYLWHLEIPSTRLPLEQGLNEFPSTRP
jgi:hypothetical protein